MRVAGHLVPGAWIALALAVAMSLSACRALTEPGGRKDPAPAPLLTGQVALPAGHPIEGVEVRLDNRFYVDDERKWINQRLFVEPDGTFTSAERFEGLLDVFILPDDGSELRSFAFLGLSTEDLPWQLEHPAVEIRWTVAFPESLQVDLDLSELELRRSRPRPLGLPSWTEQRRLDIGPAGEVSDWVEPGLWFGDLDLVTNDALSVDYDFPGDLEVVAGESRTLGAGLVPAELELVLPPGLPTGMMLDLVLTGKASTDAPEQIEVRAGRSLDGSSVRVWGPAWLTGLSVRPSSMSIRTLVSGFSRWDRPIQEVGPIRVGDHWVRVRLRGPSGHVGFRCLLDDADDAAVSNFDFGGECWFLVRERTHRVEIIDSANQPLWSDFVTVDRNLTIDVEL